MASSNLSRIARYRPQTGGQKLLGDICLEPGRVHEFCGNARHTFALILAGAMRGAVFWIGAPWRQETLNPDGMLGLADPARFFFLAPERQEDLLWTMEETLRAGAVSLVITELPEPPGLTPVRRLHLAAEAGRAESGTAPLGILLTPGEGGAQGVESRWHVSQDHAADGGTGWQLRRLRARRAAPKSWRAEPAGPSRFRLMAPPKEPGQIPETRQIRPAPSPSEQKPAPEAAD